MSTSMKFIYKDEGKLFNEKFVKEIDSTEMSEEESVIQEVGSFIDFVTRVHGCPDGMIAHAFSQAFSMRGNEVEISTVENKEEAVGATIGFHTSPEKD